MPSKKKKFNARFPPARIKKIMQTDEDVGKVAAAVPVIISRALELFIESFIQRTATITKERNAKTLSATHIKQTIHSEKTFDFLRDLVVNVPDHQPEEDGDSNASIASGSSTQEAKKPRTQRPRKEKSGAGRGRPRKRDTCTVKQEEIEEEKENTESEEDEEDGSDTDSSPATTEQLKILADQSATSSTVMQTSVLSDSQDSDSVTASVCQMTSSFLSPPSGSSMSACLPPPNPISPRLPLLQSSPQFPNVPMLPHPQFPNIPLPPVSQLQNVPVPQLLHNMPRPDLQSLANHTVPPHPGMFPPHSGMIPPLPGMIPPPPSLTRFPNPLPIPPNLYPPHIPPMPGPYSSMSSNQTFHSDQNLTYTNSRETTQIKHPGIEQVNPGKNYMNTIQNNEPLDMTKPSRNKRSPSPSQEPGSKRSKQTAELAGLPNIMNMSAPKQTSDEDDDYDT